MTFLKLSGIAAVCCTLSTPAWSGVPHAHQRIAQNNEQNTMATANIKPGRDECERIATLERDLALTKSRVDEVLNHLRALTAAGR